NSDNLSYNRARLQAKGKNWLWPATGLAGSFPEPEPSSAYLYCWPVQYRSKKPDHSPRKTLPISSSPEEYCPNYPQQYYPACLHFRDILPEVRQNGVFYRGLLPYSPLRLPGEKPQCLVFLCLLTTFTLLF